MNHFDEASYQESLDASISSLDFPDFHDDLPLVPQRKLSGIIRPVYVDYGMKSIMVRLDMNENFTEVKRVVEAKTGIPMDEQILSLTHNGRQIDGEKSLRELSYWGGAFCTVTKA